LKILARYRVGINNADLKVATRNGIIITYTLSINTNAIAKHIFAPIMVLVRDNLKLNEMNKQGAYEIGREVLAAS